MQGGSLQIGLQVRRSVVEFHPWDHIETSNRLPHSQTVQSQPRILLCFWFWRRGLKEKLPSFRQPHPS